MKQIILLLLVIVGVSGCRNKPNDKTWEISGNGTLTLKPIPDTVRQSKTIDSLNRVIDSLKVGNHWDFVRAPTYVIHTYYKNGKKQIDSVIFNIEP